MAARMVNATPTANANLAGFGAICSPHGFQYPVPVPVLVLSLPAFRGAHRGRCVSYFTLRINGNNKGPLYQYAGRAYHDQPPPFCDHSFGACPDPRATP